LEAFILAAFLRLRLHSVLLVESRLSFRSWPWQLVDSSKA
jgi:hypothetical protein